MKKEELLYKYFLEELTAEEHTMFDTLLEKDPEFKAQFEFEKSVQRVIKAKKRAVLKKKLTAIDQEPQSLTKGGTISWKPWAIAASVAVIVSLSVYLYSTWEHSPDQLYASYYEKYPNTVYPIVRSADQPITPELLAFEAYEADEDEKAIQLFTELKEKAHAEYIDFYLGQSYLKDGQIENAIATFNRVIAENNVFAEESRWFLALAYIKIDRIAEATKSLEEIMQNKSYKQTEALALLQKLD